MKFGGYKTEKPKFVYQRKQNPIYLMATPGTKPITYWYQRKAGPLNLLATTSKFRPLRPAGSRQPDVEGRLYSRIMSMENHLWCCGGVSE